jgi:selenide, water dikinase
MVELNAEASEVARAVGARAVTDVTGFGLLGHLHNMCRESGLAASIDVDAVPFLAGVDDLLADDGGVSGGSRRNAAWADGFTTFGDAVPAWRRRLLTDATTSGGLLVAVDPLDAEALPGPVIGRLGEGPAGTIGVL